METLEVLLDKYESLLSNKLFFIKLKNGNTFNIRFEPANFGHLLGLQYCAEDPNDPRSIAKYSGLNAISGIRDGTITFKKLEQNNRKQFNKYILRKTEAFNHFCSLFPNSFKSFEAVVFDSKRVVEANDRELGKAVLIIQDKFNLNIKFVFFFGQDREDKPLYPLSFRKEMSQTIDYLDLQTKIDIEDIGITSLIA